MSKPLYSRGGKLESIYFGVVKDMQNGGKWREVAEKYDISSRSVMQILQREIAFQKELEKRYATDPENTPKVINSKHKKSV